MKRSLGTRDRAEAIELHRVIAAQVDGEFIALFAPCVDGSVLARALLT